MTSMAERLRAFRGAVGLTQQQLADMCHIGKRTIIYWEMAERDIRCSKLLPLYNEYDLNFNWLITGDGEMYLNPDQVEPQASLADPGMSIDYADQDSAEPAPEPQTPVHQPKPEPEGLDRDVLPLIERLRRQ